MRLQWCVPGGRRVSRFLADQRGVAAPLLALAFPVMIGGMALGTEAGYWFLTQRQIQHAADLAAHAAAVAKRSGGTESQMHEAALRIARGSGFEDATDTLPPPASPPTSGDYVDQDHAVEVRVSRQQERYFTRIYADDPVEISARAVAAVEGGTTACLLALSPSAPGAVTVSGSSEVAFQDCDLASNSVAADSFAMSGSALVSTGCVNVVGGAQVTAGLTLTDCPEVNVDEPVIADPYAAIPEPDAICNDADPMHFCSGLTISGNVALDPGLYIIQNGDFTVQGGAVLSGSGVTFYLGPGVNISFAANAEFNLAAPESGPYAGLLFFGSRTASAADHRMNGTAASVLNGAIYTPASRVDFKGNFTGMGGGCTQIVSDRVEISGNATLAVDCQATGVRPIMVRQEVRLVE